MNGGVEIIHLLNEELIRAQARNPQYSIRAFAKRLDLFPSALSELLSGKRQVTAAMAEKILFRLGVDPESSHKIRNSIGPVPRRKRAKRVSESCGPVPGEFQQLNMDKFHILAEWFYFAVYSLAETRDFRDEPKWIADRLSITLRQARQALERLERIGLFERDAAGVVRTTGIQIATSTDVASLSLRKSHFQNLELAKHSLEVDDLLERDFSSITMATTRAKLAEAKARIRKFRRELCAFMEAEDAGPKTDVFQMNVQLFPLSRQKRSKR